VKLGFHVSIVDSLDQSFDKARQLGCSAFQIFTRNPRTWRSKPLDEAIIEAFRWKHRTYGIGSVFSHMPYLPNLASPDETIYRKSVDSLIEEVERCHLLGIRFVVTHMGSHVGSGAERGKARIIQALYRAIEHDGPVILLENGSGSGNHLGSHLEEVAEILATVGGSRVGSCFDTCHAYGAGYDVATKEGLAQTLRIIRKTIGFDKLMLVHLNDSYGDLSSGIDHHAHIGLGKIGEEGFRNILASQLARRPMVMETPIDDRRCDADNMDKVIELAGLSRQ
jgi:deoxyribonuclease-4